MSQLAYDEPKLGWIADVVTGLACTGMRIDELANLKWSDVDCANNRITLTDESSRGGGDSPKQTLKSSHSRSFPIHPDLSIELNRLSKTDEYVFHGPGGGRLKPDYIRLMFVRDVLRPFGRPLVCKAGLKNRSFASAALAMTIVAMLVLGGVLKLLSTPKMQVHASKLWRVGEILGIWKEREQGAQ